MATMKILQVTGPGAFEIRCVPVPTPAPDEALVRVTAVTTCPQWDLHLRRDEPMFVGHSFHYPYTAGQPGHEATGYVEAVGPGVTDLAVGDRVSAWRDPGHERPGCYAQFVVHRAANLIRVPEGPPDEALAPIELAMCVGTVFRMLREMRAADRRVFGIAGLGPAGLIAGQMARAEGAVEVIGFDLSARRREIALGSGFDACYDSREVGTDAVPTRDRGARLQTSVDCVGSRTAVHFLLDRTADVVALFGVQREDFTFAVRHHSLRLCGYQGHHRESAEYAVRLIEQGTLDLAPLVTHTMPLERYGEGVDLLERQEAVKVCFLPWEE